MWKGGLEEKTKRELWEVSERAMGRSKGWGRGAILEIGLDFGACRKIQGIGLDDESVSEVPSHSVKTLQDVKTRSLVDQELASALAGG